jgi:hypothetical protein
VLQYLWLIPVGFIIGGYGTFIGAGGGFLLVPFLLLFYPRESVEVVTSISLAVIFFNTLSGSVAYARMRRIDYRSSLLFSLATIPGAIAGVLTTGYVPRRIFHLVFGVFMILASAYLMIHPRMRAAPGREGTHRQVSRSLMEADGTVHTFTYNRLLAVCASLAIGYLSSMLGIGGGIISVPVLAHLLNFPVSVATATSQFTTTIMALTGATTHIATGAFHRGIRRTLALTLGAVFGAQLGAWLAGRVQGNWVIRSLAVGLGLVGLRVLLMAFGE